MVNRTKDTLESVKKFVQLSRGRFRDKEFGDFFYRVVTEDIEKTDAVLTNIADYVKLGTPIRKMNTVHTFIEELLKKYKLQFEEKKIEVFKDFEDDLPEVTVPDEHLRYILDTILQYTIATIFPDSHVELLTQSHDIRSAAEKDQTFPKPNGKYVEISVVFTGFEKPMGGVETPPSQKGIESDLELRLVDDLIKKNNGMMDFGADVDEVKTFISVKFPVERRNIIFYKAVNQ